MSRQVTAIVIGAGGRGNCYASYAEKFPDKLKIVGVAEPRDFYRTKMAKDYNIAEKNIYCRWEDIAERGKFADVAIIATPDAIHVGPAVAIAQKGYHMLLEKPLAPTWDECKEIEAVVKENGKLFCVCHVLRYTAYTKKLKEMLNSGLIGDIVSIQHLEPVGYGHQAHTFVRGNSRNTAESSFMLLQKSCHDLDWLHYIVGVDCKEVSSFGNLKYFKKKNKPDGASDRCTDCAIEEKCPYSAVKMYIRQMAGRKDNPYFGWPVAMLTSDLTVDGVMEALRTGPYGRCVYACDNDVVDHQVVNMLFVNDVTVSFTMTAFTEHTDRKTRIFGTRGQLEGDGEKIVHYDFLTEKTTEINTGISSDGGIMTGHGGGDFGMMKNFVEAVADGDGSKIISGLQDTMESHRMVFAAEKARLEHKVVSLKGDL